MEQSNDRGNMDGRKTGEVKLQKRGVKDETDLQIN